MRSPFRHIANIRGKPINTTNFAMPSKASAAQIRASIIYKQLKQPILPLYDEMQMELEKIKHESPYELLQRDYGGLKGCDLLQKTRLDHDIKINQFSRQAFYEIGLLTTRKEVKRRLLRRGRTLNRWETWDLICQVAWSPENGLYTLRYPSHIAGMSSAGAPAQSQPLQCRDWKLVLEPIKLALKAGLPSNQ